MFIVICVALFAMTLVSLALAWACKRLQRELNASANYCGLLEQQYASKDRLLSGILRVLDDEAGGIGKRVSENGQIADAISREAPDVFRQCSALPYWLSANDQFLLRLYEAAAGVDDRHRSAVRNFVSAEEGQIFARIFDKAGLPLSRFESEWHTRRSRFANLFMEVDHV